MVAIELVIKFLVTMALGFLLYKLKMLNKETNALLSKVVLYAICPCMVFVAVAEINGQATKIEVVNVMILGIILYIALFILAFILTKIFRVPKESAAIYNFFIVFGNVGFIGIPISDALFGSLGVFYMAILNIHMNAFLYSYGLWLVTKDLKTESKFSVKKIFNPAFLILILVLILFFLDIKVPEEVISPIDFIGQATPVLSMLILGSTIASHSLKNVFSHWRVYVFGFIRMIIMPVATFFILKVILGPGTLTNVVTLYMGMPIAVALEMFTVAYGGEEEISSAGVTLTNIFCIVTIPATYWFVTSFS